MYFCLPYCKKDMEKQIKPHFWALTPLFVFLGVYLVASLIINDFYKIPITVAFVIASIVAVSITRHLPLHERITHFSTGASDKNIMLMIWIFILAGAFAQSAKAMGAIDATVNLALQILPGRLLLAGIFIAVCFISLSIGTSVGTIVALVPVVGGIAEKTGMNLPFMVAIVVGGAFFGDNLSFISDTTIAATQTQGCRMKDKFKANSMIVLPAAIVLLVFYIFKGIQLNFPTPVEPIEWIKIVPYLIVLTSALFGINVIIVLLSGIFATGAIGMYTSDFDLFGYFGALGNGITGMGELIIITLLAGGILEMIRYNGGISYIIDLLTRHVNSKRFAEVSIAGLVCLANLCTANNTIAIITVGPIARNIAKRFDIDKRKSASILDTFSCFTQGIIPYGAQMLIAAELAGVSPLSIIGYLYYPFLIGICGLAAILFRYPKRYS